MRQRGRCLSIPLRFTRGHLDYTRQSRSACTERTENKNYCFCFHGVEVPAPSGLKIKTIVFVFTESRWRWRELNPRLISYQLHIYENRSVDFSHYCRIN